MIEFSSVFKSFGEKKILEDVSLKILEGEILFLLGQSGTGKSVTLKQIVGLLKPDGGSIKVHGEEISHLSEEELFEVRRNCSYVFQNPSLVDELNIEENVLLPTSKKDLDQKHFSRECLKKVGFRPPEAIEDSWEFETRFPFEVSYGEQKRIAIARALASNPKYLLFDEPTTGLDPILTRSVFELIKSLAKQLKITMAVVSHDMLSAIEYADRILVLHQGSIVANSTPKDILKSEHPLIQSFLEEVT